MNAGKLFGRGFGFPLRVGEDGRLVWSEGEENIRESIRLILLTEPKERLMLPEFGCGLSRFLMEPNNVATRAQIRERVTRSLEKWEPRIVVESVSVEEAPDEPRAAVMAIVYKLAATQAREQLNLRVSFTQ
jgi:phage baseplate assembly protein W